MAAPRQRLRPRLRARRAPKSLNPRSQDGFTLFEALMAAVILVVGLIGLLGLLDSSVKASAATRAREGATGLAREILEDARTIPYAQIGPTSMESQLQAMNGLADSSSETGWQIDRRGFTFTVTVKECAIDNPKDGLAKTHEASAYCTGQQNWEEGDAEDSEPEDLKRIAVAVSWTVQKSTSSVTQVSTLTAAGQATGLAATKLELKEPLGFSGTKTEPVITEEATKVLTFSVSFPEDTSSIIWSLEGAKQEELKPASNATSLSFSWTINESAKKVYVSDGTYEIAVQAESSTGVIGPPISIPVRLIRGKPAAPGGIEGGYNTLYDEGATHEAVEIQWKANAERNVIGYRVHGPSNELICPESSETLSTATSCIDFGAASTSERSYTVSTLYREAKNEVTEGPASSITVTRTASIAPNAPTELVLTKNANGSVTLKWTAPTGGTAPSFYRIYRGSKNYTSRYSETTATEYTDSESSTTHEYWVTAVSSTLTESPFLGPVTG